ncbi:hypothetical protein J9303_06575 [Bacillaceae bacterium Marseille-Q3522]|nr:hypothetical protein [Bacillaceae bacterium Marseille-Q3522]
MEKSKAERKRDRKILEKYEQKLTEDELDKLYQQFNEWKAGKLGYDELTARIHQFHKKNQKIWSMFHDGYDEFLIFEAKKELNMFSEDNLNDELYQHWLDLIGK